MTIAIVLPRNMHFGPARATSIDLVAHDAVAHSRYRDETVVICQQSDDYYDGFEIRPYPGGSTRARVRQVAEILREIGPSLIVVHQHLPSAAALARIFSETPVILHKHNFIEPVTWFRRMRRYRQLNRLAGIVFVSEACRTDFVRDFPGARARTFVAHNCLVPGDWPPAPEKAREIVAIGRIEHRKGQVEIAEALSRVLPEFPDWRARFIGALEDDAEVATAFRRLVEASPQIDWPGPVPFAEIVAATRRASIAVVNSRKEAFGRVAIEAFAGEAALISSDCGGLKEVIGDAAAILHTGDADEIATHLRDLLGDQAKREELAQKGRQRFEELFTPAVTASQLDDAYAAFL
ncbi:glycosyltransferase family 4 protein [Rhodobacteraceae bacterium NNCM2]|nr:glycosyltransferase family 4 protein [Coraliihabitans acroporae]